jgi:Glutathione S-transferase, N-terminal domain
MVLKIYGNDVAGVIRLVAWVLREKKVPYEFIDMDFSKNEHKSAEHLEKQPFGQAPYIVCDVLNLPSALIRLFFSRMMTVSYFTKPELSAITSPQSTLTKAPRYSQLNSRPMRCSSKHLLVKSFNC